jgi:hypothetical protein
VGLLELTFLDQISVLPYFCHFPLSHILSGKSEKRAPFARNFQFKLKGWQRSRILEKINIIYYLRVRPKGISNSMDGKEQR